jgi:hypothetical protein
VTHVVSRMLEQIKDALSPLRRGSFRCLEASFLKAMFDNYRPERHYMRGSGPKSRSMNGKQDGPAKGS